jgi:hypothetical protein
MSDKQREAFERDYTLPEGIFWNETHKYYDSLGGYEELAQLVQIRYSGFLDGWQLAHEAMFDEIPEGCTPVDARKLREYNHDLADENTELRQQIKLLKRDLKQARLEAQKYQQCAQDSQCWNWLHAKTWSQENGLEYYECSEMKQLREIAFDVS